MAATQQYKAKVLFLHLAQKRMFIKEAVWFNILKNTVSIPCLVFLSVTSSLCDQELRIQELEQSEMVFCCETPKLV